MSKNWVVISAAGSGMRFSNEIPKQYLQVNQKTILEYSTALFLNEDWVSQIVISHSAQDQHFSKLPLAKQEKVTPVIGGSSRLQSVLNALHYLKSMAHDDDWVLVHDAVRPCLHLDDLANLRNALQDDPVGGILAAPVHDTVKHIAQGNAISHTVDRQPLWHALTPQMFRFGLLWKALVHCSEQQCTITDDASAIEYYGLPAKVVEARFPNPKLTYTRDLPYIAMLLNAQKEECIV